MAFTPTKIIEYLRDIDAEYKDGRVVSEREHRALVWFLVYGENVFSQIGHTWRGCSFRQSDTTCLMTVKGGTKSIPQVAYVTGRTPTDCVVIFCRKWHGDRVQWFPDKYA